MKISNKLFSEQQVGQFAKQMESIQKVQEKISSGKNIIFASDDPVGAVQLSGLNDIKCTKLLGISSNLLYLSNLPFLLMTNSPINIIYLVNCKI